MKPIVVVGSINSDLVVTTKHLPLKGETITGRTFDTYQGGKGANQAVAAARLGAKVAMIGKVGSDSFGSESIRQLEGHGVDCSHVGIEYGPSGIAVITVAEGGQNTIVVVPGANGAVSSEFIATKRTVIREAGLVLAQLEIPLSAVLTLAEICREEGVPLMLDPAPAQDLPAGLMALCEWFTPNETEAEFYMGGAAVSSDGMVAELRGLGARNVVLKLGERGALIDVLDGDTYSIDPVAVHAKDTTAAGDTFNGALAAGLSEGMGIAKAGAFAARAAALSVTKPGAQASMPTRAEVEAIL
jgi:ribokinase